MKKPDVKMEADYFICPVDSSVNHKGFFTGDTRDTEVVKAYLGAVTVEVRPVPIIADVAKKTKKQLAKAILHSFLFVCILLEFCCLLV